MQNELITKLLKNFEEHTKREGETEYWLARELQLLLGYEKWQNFETLLERAKIACIKAKQQVTDHFVDINKMVDVGKGGTRQHTDIKLTRYACYLIAQNGDPRKDEIAFAMNYFAIQTRKQELLEQRMKDWERVQAREKLTLSEKEFSGVVFERGIDNPGFARIRSKGDAALFGGYNTSDMKLKLSVPAKRPLADFLPTVTIKAKDFANEITTHNLKKDRSIEGEGMITKEHTTNNKQVRDVLVKRGIYPESLPREDDVKQMVKTLKDKNKITSKNSTKLKKK